jgi:hypothetical protein
VPISSPTYPGQIQPPPLRQPPRGFFEALAHLQQRPQRTVTELQVVEVDIDAVHRNPRWKRS